MSLPLLRLVTQAHRAHDPRWSWAPESAAGACRHGGRFNPPGLGALYTSLSAKTALLEAQQGFPLKAQPVTLCAYEVDCADVLDLTDAGARRAAGTDADALACAWEARRMRGQRPESWRLAERLVEAGVAAIVVPSYAPGAGPDDHNVVFWRWGPDAPHRVRVIDDDTRLPRSDRSWR